MNYELGNGERGEEVRAFVLNFPDQFKYSTTEKTNNKPLEFVLG
jgi:hypothetical protein